MEPNEQAIIDTLNTMIKPGYKSRRTGKTIGSPGVDYKAQLEYLKNNYDLDEITQVLIDNPEVLELVQGRQISGAKSRDLSFEPIVAQELKYLLEKHGPESIKSLLESQSTMSQSFLKKFHQGKINQFLYNYLGFGRESDPTKGRVKKTDTGLLGAHEPYIESTGYFDPKEWGQHKQYQYGGAIQDTVQNLPPLIDFLINQAGGGAISDLEAKNIFSGGGVGGAHSNIDELIGLNNRSGGKAGREDNFGGPVPFPSFPGLENTAIPFPSFPGAGSTAIPFPSFPGLEALNQGPLSVDRRGIDSTSKNLGDVRTIIEDYVNKLFQPGTGGPSPR